MIAIAWNCQYYSINFLEKKPSTFVLAILVILYQTFRTLLLTYSSNKPGYTLTTLDDSTEARGSAYLALLLVSNARIGQTKTVLVMYKDTSGFRLEINNLCTKIYFQSPSMLLLNIIEEFLGSETRTLHRSSSCLRIFLWQSFMYNINFMTGMIGLDNQLNICTKRKTLC